jgi:hypothetical protein
VEGSRTPLPEPQFTTLLPGSPETELRDRSVWPQYEQCQTMEPNLGG